jgi:hypothetical protein
MTKNKWIQDAIKHRGALRKTASKQGLIKGDEKLSMSDLNKLEKEGGKTAKQASLAKTLRTFADGGVIASNIIMQLGGFSRLQIMLGAYNFVDLKNGVSFKIKNARSNYIKITLNSNDLYDIEIGRIRGTTYKVVYKQEDVYAVDLKHIIENKTGMFMAFEDGGDVPMDMEILVISQSDILANGGITALEVLEARDFVGEDDWKKMKPKERLSATRYLVKTGKIGYYEKKRSKYADGVRLNKYRVKYLIGYTDEEDGLKYQEGFFYADNKDNVAIEVFEHFKRLGYSHIEILGIMLVADKGMDIIVSDEELNEKYSKLKGNNIPDWFRDMPTRYKEEIIEEIEEDEFSKGGGIGSKRDNVINYYINNSEDDVLMSEFDVSEDYLIDRNGNYSKIFDIISDNLDDEDISYKFDELNLGEDSEEPEEKYDAGGLTDDGNDTFVMLFKAYGFVEKRGSYGTKTFYNKSHNAYIYYDPKYRSISGYVGGGEGNDEVIPYSVEGVLNFFIENNITESESTPLARGGNIEYKIKERLSKSFELPLQMAVYVPSTKDKNVVVSKEELAYRVKVVEKYLATLFGGFNSAKVDGGFKSVDKGVINEDAVRVVAFANPEGFEPKFEKLVNKVKQWCKLWSQESIGLEFENDLFYIEQDSKFSDGGYMAGLPKFKVGDMVYSYQNTNYAAPINAISSSYTTRRSGVTNYYVKTYRYQLSLKYGNSFPWISEKALYKTKQLQYDEDEDESRIEYMKGFAKGGKVKNPSPDYPDFISMQYKKGGALKYYDKENEYKIGRPSGYIEKEVLSRVDSNEEDFVGSFGWKTENKKLADGYLYKLSDFDKELVKNIRLKSDEKIFRYLNRTSAIGGMKPLIKINLDKELLYFMNDSNDISFETRGIQAIWITLIEHKL